MKTAFYRSRFRFGVSGGRCRNASKSIANSRAIPGRRKIFAALNIDNGLAGDRAQNGYHRFSLGLLRFDTDAVRTLLVGRASGSSKRPSYEAV